jgi:sugar phosphate isomerase/epimerase
MELSHYTDSVPNLTLDDALDLSVDVGCSSVEIAAGGQSSAPHMKIFELQRSASARAELAGKLTDRGLRMSAMNCSAWPMHPVHGDKHLHIMKAAVEVAGELGIDKIVTMSGCPGDSPNAKLINWIFYPWPPEGMDLLERQWAQTIAFWSEFAPFAADHGITKIALELHPMHLVYNVPTLLRLREAIGPIIGANVDPSHMFWQRMDPAACVRALGDAVHHVHLKDVEYRDDQLGLAGVLDNRGFGSPAQRAWTFRTVGKGHGAEFWKPFLDALVDIGYDDAVSMENEDPIQPAAEGITEAAAFILKLMPPLGRQVARR